MGGIGFQGDVVIVTQCYYFNELHRTFVLLRSVHICVWCGRGSVCGSVHDEGGGVCNEGERVCDEGGGVCGVRGGVCVGWEGLCKAMTRLY